MLCLFDIDGTLVRSFMREGGGGTSQAYDLIEVLPGRAEKLRELREAGHDMAVVTNQGGVAFGYQNTDQVHAKVRGVMEAVGFDIETPSHVWCTKPWQTRCRAQAYVSLGHAQAKVDEYRRLHEAYPDWRKPGGGMIEQAMHDYGVTADDTLYVGDMDSDRLAAEAAGVAFEWADQFFGDVVPPEGR